MHMLDYINVNKLKTHFPDIVWQIPPETTCIWLCIWERERGGHACTHTYTYIHMCVCVCVLLVFICGGDW